MKLNESSPTAQPECLRGPAGAQSLAAALEKLGRLEGLGVYLYGNKIGAGAQGTEVSEASELVPLIRGIVFDSATV